MQILGMHEFMHQQLRCMDLELSQRFASARVQALLSGDTVQADKLKAGEFMTIDTSDADAIKAGVLSQYAPATAPPGDGPLPPPRGGSWGNKGAQPTPTHGRRSSQATGSNTIHPRATGVPSSGRRSEPSTSRAPVENSAPASTRNTEKTSNHEGTSSLTPASAPPQSALPEPPPVRGGSPPPSLRSSSPSARSTASSKTRGGRKRPKGGGKRKGVVAARFVHKTESAWGEGEYVAAAPRRGPKPKRNWGPGAAKPKPKLQSSTQNTKKASSSGAKPAAKRPAAAGGATRAKPLASGPAAGEKGGSRASGEKGGSSAAGLPSDTPPDRPKAIQRSSQDAAKRSPQDPLPVNPKAMAPAANTPPTPPTQPAHEGSAHRIDRPPDKSSPTPQSTATAGPPEPDQSSSIVSETGPPQLDDCGASGSAPQACSGAWSHTPTSPSTSRPGLERMQGGASPPSSAAVSSPQSPEDDVRIGARLPPVPGTGNVAGGVSPPHRGGFPDGAPTGDSAALAESSGATVVPLKTKAYTARGGASVGEGGLHSRAGFSPRAVAAEAMRAVDSRAPPQDMSYAVGASEAAGAEMASVMSQAHTMAVEGDGDGHVSSVQLVAGSSGACATTARDGSDTGGDDPSGEADSDSDSAPSSSSDEAEHENLFPLVGEAYNSVARAFPTAGAGSAGDAGSSLGGLAGSAARSKKAQAAELQPVGNGQSLRHVLGACIDGLRAAGPILRQFLRDTAAAAVAMRSTGTQHPPHRMPVDSVAEGDSSDGGDSDTEQQQGGAAGGVGATAHFPASAAGAQLPHDEEQPVFQLEQDEDELTYFVAARYYLTSGRKIGLLLRRALQSVQADEWQRLPRHVAHAALQAGLPVMRCGQVVPADAVPASTHADFPRWLRVVWLPLPREQLAPAAAQLKAAQAVSANAVLASACSVWLYWGGRKHAPPHTLLAAWQRTNHFQRHGELTRKDSLQRNLRRYAVLGGKMAAAFHVMPETFVLPGQYMAFAEAYGRDLLKSQHSERQRQFREGASLEAVSAPSSARASGVECSMWIVKPLNSSCGRGIRVISELEEVNFSEAAVLQRYLHTPMLLDGFKFDLRVYVLVTRFAPLEAYVYSNGLARFSSKPYTTSAEGHSDKLVHLTNSSIQKHTGAVLPFLQAATEQEAAGTKCSLAYLWGLIAARGGNATGLWKEVKLCVLKSLVCVDDVIRSQPSCFELYGFDVMLDSAGKGWLIEVNASPSLACGTALDTQLKTAVMRDTLRLVSPSPVLPSLLEQTLQTAASAGNTPSGWADGISRSTLNTRVRPYGAPSPDVVHHTDCITRGGSVLPFQVPVDEETANGFELLCPNTPEHSAITELKYSVFTSSLNKAGR